MPPPSQPCPHCGRAFFPASLNIHVPQCQQKMARMVVPCPACGLEVRQGELNDHMFAQCKEARKAMAPQSPSGTTTSRSSGGRAQRSSSASRRPHTERSNSAKGLRSQASRHALNGPAECHGRTPKTERSQPPKALPMQMNEAAADGRVPCARCGRKFAPDRIAQHQFICVQLKRGPAKPAAEVGERAREIAAAGHHQPGYIAASRRGASAAARPDGRRQAYAQQAAPKPKYSKWREQSLELQSAMRAARGAPRLEQRGGFRNVEAYGGYGARGMPNTFSSGRPSKPVPQTMAQRAHAAESQRLQESALSSPQRRAPVRTQCNGAVIHGGGGGFPGVRQQPGQQLPGSGGGPGGFDPLSNQTSRDNPFYRGY